MYNNKEPKKKKKKGSPYSQTCYELNEDYIYAIKKNGIILPLKLISNKMPCSLTCTFR